MPAGAAGVSICRFAVGWGRRRLGAMVAGPWRRGAVAVRPLVGVRGPAGGADLGKAEDLALPEVTGPHLLDHRARRLPLVLDGLEHGHGVGVRRAAQAGDPLQPLAGQSPLQAVQDQLVTLAEGVENAAVVGLGAADEEVWYEPLPPAVKGGYLRSFLDDIAGVTPDSGLDTAAVLESMRTAITIQEAANHGAREVELR